MVAKGVAAVGQHSFSLVRGNCGSLIGEMVSGNSAVAQGRAQGKPVAITEFGCAAFRGAADQASRGISDVVEWDDHARPVRLKGVYMRNEHEQARYITELLDVCSARDAVVSATPTCRGSPRPRSTRSPTATAGSTGNQRIEASRILPQPVSLEFR